MLRWAYRSAPNRQKSSSLSFNLDPALLPYNGRMKCCTEMPTRSSMQTTNRLRTLSIKSCKSLTWSALLSALQRWPGLTFYYSLDKRNKHSRKRKEGDHDVTYINDANKHFNKKLQRYALLTIFENPLNFDAGTTTNIRKRRGTTSNEAQHCLFSYFCCRYSWLTLFIIQLTHLTTSVQWLCTPALRL